MKPEHYKRLRQQLVELGYGGDIAWAEKVSTPASSTEFATEYVFVVCNSGMRAQIAREIFAKVMGALDAGQHPSTVFGHSDKAEAIWQVWQNRVQWYLRFMSLDDTKDQVEFLGSMPWIGNITKWHLAKNVGIDAVKPDRHLVRVAASYDTTPDKLCQELADATGDRIGTVDYVIWRACNLSIIGSVPTGHHI